MEHGDWTEWLCRLTGADGMPAHLQALARRLCAEAGGSSEEAADCFAEIMEHRWERQAGIEALPVQERAAYVWACAQHCARRYLWRERRQAGTGRRAADTDLEYVPDSDTTGELEPPARSLLDTISREDLPAALPLLDPDDYEVLNAHYFRRQTDAELGAELGITRAAAIKRRQRAEARLRALVMRQSKDS